MSANLNKVMIIGRLGNDPDYKVTPSNFQICKLSVATSEKFKDKTTGDWKEETEWHRVTLFGNLADIANKYLKKGRAVYIEGRLKTSSYDKDGEKRYSTEIIGNTMQMLDSINANSGDSSPRYSDSPMPAEVDTQINQDDDIPF